MTCYVMYATLVSIQTSADYLLSSEVLPLQKKGGGGAEKGFWVVLTQEL